MKCLFCDKNIENKGGLAVHEKHCKQNPNREQKIRSPLAGAKKGSKPWNTGLIVGRSKGWDKRYALDEVLVEGSTYARHHIKKRIIDNGLISYTCACCGIGPEWCGKPMPLILDHINGVNNDNRIENLRFVCSNCDSQLDTYKSKNRRSMKQ